MKKVCPECGKINDYEATVCQKCGAALDRVTYKKICPECGKEFSMLPDVCDECGQTLIVLGDASARIFDETQREEVPIPIRLLSAFLPVIGWIIAAVWCIFAVDSGRVERQTSRTMLVTSAGIQVMLIVVIAAVWITAAALL